MPWHLAEELRLLVKEHCCLSTSPAVVVDQAGQHSLDIHHHHHHHHYHYQLTPSVDIQTDKPGQPVVRVS